MIESRISRALIGAPALALVGAAFLLGGAGPAAAADPGEPRLEGSFSMSGTVTRAKNVRGEKKGQKVKRTWSFAGSCTGGPCDTVILKRGRGGGQTDRVVLHRQSAGKYSGNGRFFFRIRCAGRVEKKGGEARYKVAVRVTQATDVQGKPFASALVATYDNGKRINHTQCHGGLGSDAARYTGQLKAAPTPPTADFTSTPSGATTRSFTDRSSKGSAPIVAWAWDFGDPTSMDNTSSERNPSHTFVTPGVHNVQLTVTDRNGLTGTVSHVVG